MVIFTDIIASFTVLVAIGKANGMRARVEAVPNKSAREPKGKKMDHGSNVNLKSTLLFLCGFARTLPLTKRYKDKIPSDFPQTSMGAIYAV